MTRECEVVQLCKRKKINLVTGRLKSEKSNDKGKIYQRIWNEDTLKTSYTKISKNKGANTRGISEETLDGYSLRTISKVSLSLKDHSFQFKPVRRIEIPKTNGSKRKLGIPSPRDKIVQQAMVTVLEEIYEKKFSNKSHGFRPKRGVHTAIKEVTG